MIFAPTMNLPRPFHVLVCQDAPGSELVTRRYARCTGALVTSCAAADLAARCAGPGPVCDLLDLHVAPGHAASLLRACPGAAGAVALPVPFAGSPTEGEQLVRFLKKRGSLGWVRNFYLFEPACARLFELVGSGVLGSLRRLDCTLHDADTGRENSAVARPHSGGAPARFLPILDLLLRLLPDAGDPTDPVLETDGRTLTVSFPRGPRTTIQQLPAAPGGPDHWLIEGANGTLRAEITPGLAATDAEPGRNRVWLESGGRCRDFPVPPADAASLFLATAILAWRTRHPTALLAPAPTLRAQVFLTALRENP